MKKVEQLKMKKLAKDCVETSAKMFGAVHRDDVTKANKHLAALEEHVAKLRTLMEA